MVNSTEWFYDDPWLDFTMIQTHIHRNKLVDAIRQEMVKLPVKPVVLAEGHYEGMTNGKTPALAIHIRRQAYQTFFAGAVGHTYGGGIDENGNGPLFSPAYNWKKLLDWEGAGQFIHLRKFLEENDWWKWQPSPELISKGRGKGELEKLGAINGDTKLIYFPENSSCTLSIEKVKKIRWFSTQTAEVLKGQVNINNEYQPPQNWEDGILIIN